MLTSIFPWWRRKKPAPITQGLTIYELIQFHLGELHELNLKKFSPSKAQSTKLACTTRNLEELEKLLIEASIFVSKGQYLPESWKGRSTRKRETSLDHYITEDNDLIHPLDWIELQRHHILKLTDAIQKMDRADAEYYQRKTNFIIEDLNALVAASRLCLK